MIMKKIYNKNELPIFVKWMEFLKWLLSTTEKFHKKTRFTFINRINNIGIDIAQCFVEAQYLSEKVIILKQINMKLEHLRILLRLCHELQYLSHKSYEFSVKQINEIGKMLGGWISQQRKK